MVSVNYENAQLITSIARVVCGGILDLSIDSTGFSLDTSSYYYSHRIGRLERHRDYVKTTLAVDTRTHCVAAVKTSESKAKPQTAPSKDDTTTP